MRGERLVHLDEVHVGERQASPLQCHGRGEDRPHEQLLTRIQGSVGVRSNERQRLVA